MVDAPEPLTSPNCDLRDFPYMPLDVVRLRDAGIGAIDAEAFRAAVISWCVAWHQVPAASLPNDDQVLCRILGYGRDLKFWRKLRAAGALHGYILCNDGRFYHPVVAEKALEAMRKRGGIAAIENVKTERQKRWRERIKRLSAQLRDAGVTPPKGASLEMLEMLLVDVDVDVSASTVDVYRDDAEMPIKGREGKGEEKERKPPLVAQEKSSRKRQVPPDWEPGETGVKYAKDRGLKQSEIITFRNHHIGKGNTFANIDRAWMSWCDKAVEFGRGRVPALLGDLYASTTGVSV